MRGGAILGFIFVSALAHGLAARWLHQNFRAVRERTKLLLAITAFLSVLPGAVRVIIRNQPSSGWMAVFAVLMVEVSSVIVAVMPITLASVIARGVWWVKDRKEIENAEQVARRLEAEAVAKADADADATADADADADADAKADADADAKAEERAEAYARTVGRREAIEKGIGLSIFAGTGLAMGWGSLRGRHAFQLEEVAVKIAGWPKALDGYTIAQISDIHVGAFVGDRELEEGLEVLKRAKPDLVVATGDLVDFRAEVVTALAARLAALDVRDGVAAILGNHDHYAGPADVVEGLQRSGVRVLSNEAVRLRKGDGGGFSLIGLDDLAGRARPQGTFRGPDLARAIAMQPPDLPRILLAHQPNFLRESAGRVALQLSGHTHGGQINPGFRPADLVMTYVSGRYERDGTTLWVNRGFGVAGPPSRVGAPPEVTKIVLVAG
ncbi:MAG: metallophosphoesterase [Deltaproteobacteria bacterium]|nr:metallophosphoesterase [Deltaproteobacteria bacterium]